MSEEQSQQGKTINVNINSEQLQEQKELMTEYSRHLLEQFPEAEYCSDHGFHIGIHQDIETDQLDYIVDVVEKFLAARKAS